ncbi:TetR/AcrR family transcriptional regulator [Microbacterium sp.]|uniref:TetR/AcrR family transcriptional regulator n=1 Tax=Microbacterium sp. TaxID=51671 RepID=UPI0039E2DDF9
MSVDDRRAMIAAAAVPLFVERGASLTTRQLAEHLGIAEGTIFRAFGDRDTLVHAVVDQFFNAARDTISTALDGPEPSLEEKLRLLIARTRERAKGVFAMLSLLDPAEAREYMRTRRYGQFEKNATSTFAVDAAQLNVSPERLDAVVRLLVIAASAPHLGGTPLSDDELVEIALYGIIGRPPHDEAATGRGGKD